VTICAFMRWNRMGLLYRTGAHTRP